MDNVLAITFSEDRNAYEALTKLNELNGQGQVGLAGAAVVERMDDGSVDVKEQSGDIGWEGTATGGIIGLLIGVIGGPLGVLLGGATGLLYGSLFDMADADDTESVLTDVAQSVRVGHYSLLAQVSEQNPEVVDAAMERMGGTVVRRPTEEVEAEIAAAEEAQREAKRQARKQLHEQRREEHHEKVQAKIAELKGKLHHEHSHAGKAN
jgi:uncharacterized membrane protein